MTTVWPLLSFTTHLGISNTSSLLAGTRAVGMGDPAWPGPGCLTGWPSPVDFSVVWTLLGLSLPGAATTEIGR